MSLFGAIVDYFDDSVIAEVVTLRTAAGQDKMYTGRPPADTTLPYIAVTGVSCVPSSQSKNNASRIDDWDIQFSVFDTSLATIESLLDDLEEAYLRSNLTVANREMVSGPPLLLQRGSIEDEEGAGIWHGFLEIQFRLRKSPI